MTITVAYSTLAGGVYIERDGTGRVSPTTRCFRFDAYGRAEYAHHGDLLGLNPRPRWYGHNGRFPLDFDVVGSTLDTSRSWP